jgi:lactoylglutathione lyase
LVPPPNVHKPNDVGYILGIAHVAINVRDWAKTAWFYEDLLGFSLSDAVDMEMGFSLTYATVPGGGRLELFRNDANLPDRSPKDEELIGFRHLAFEVTGLDSLRNTLVDAGVVLALDVTDLPRLGWRVVLVEDPNGVMLEFAERQDG